jgi:hypothetical protein
MSRRVGSDSAENVRSSGEYFTIRLTVSGEARKFKDPDGNTLAIEQQTASPDNGGCPMTLAPQSGQVMPVPELDEHLGFFEGPPRPTPRHWLSLDPPESVMRRVKG